MPASETRVPLSKDTRACLSRIKESPETYDEVIRRLLENYEVDDP